MPATPTEWLAPFVANPNDAGPTQDNQDVPKLIQLTNGNIVLLYQDNSDSAPAAGGGPDLVGQIYDLLGNAVGGPFLVNAGFNGNSEINFDATALNDGRFVVVYEDFNGANVDTVIRAVEWDTDPVTGAATTFTDRTIATSPVANDVVVRPSVSARPDGSYGVTFASFDASLPGGGSSSQAFQFVNADGSLGTFTLHGGASSGINRTDITTLSDGQYAFVATYGPNASGNGIRVVLRDNSSANIINVTSLSTSRDASDPSIAALAGGGFVVTWVLDDGDDLDTHYRVYDNAGNAVSNELIVNNGGINSHNESRPIALSDGGFVIVYDDDDENLLAFQRYNASGTEVGLRVTYEQGTEFQPDGVGLADGRFAIAFSTDGPSNPGFGFNTEILMTILDPRNSVGGPAYDPEGWQIGTTLADVIIGEPDDDGYVVAGYDNNDVLFNANGAVAAEDVTGAVTILGGEGNDRIGLYPNAWVASEFDGGAGNDTLQLIGPDNFVDTVLADLTNGELTLTGSLPNLTHDILNFENFHVIGISASMTIIGTDEDNELYGGEQNDFIDGVSGIDFVSANGGDDTIEIDFFGSAGGPLGTSPLSSVDAGTGDDRVLIGGLDGSYDGVHVDLVNGEWGTIDQLFFEVFRDVEHVSLEGGNGTDSIIGTSGDNEIFTGGGDDTVLAGGGNDTVNGGLDDDTIEGGDGDDLLIDGSRMNSEGVDTIDAGAGNDTVEVFRFVSGEEFHGGAGDDFLDNRGNGLALLIDLEGGTMAERDSSATTVTISGFEHVATSGSSDVIFGSGENNSIDAGNGNNNVYGGDGTDTILGGSGRDNLEGGRQGSTGFTQADSLDGGGGRDTLVGADQNLSNGGDTLLGGDGDDLIFGNRGTDLLDGGANNDTLDAGQGDDTALGGSGDDSILGFGGNDVVDGGSGNDFINVGAGADTVEGGTGDDTITGGSFDDSLDGGGGKDLVRAGNGDDSVDGGVAGDRLLGGFGSDLLLGNNGFDDLRGEAGFDTLIGGAGNDTLRGGDQNDLFVFEDGFGTDILVDFDALRAGEKIDLVAVSAITGFADLAANHMAQDGARVIIDDGLGNTIQLNATLLADLDAGDFVF